MRNKYSRSDKILKMGTRHTQIVITKSGEQKIRQYGQWDGYPSGQGVDILSYLRNGDLKTYQKHLENIKETTQEDVDLVNETKNWSEVYPYLSRDCGSDIHQMIEDNVVKFVQHIDEKEARDWCYCFYTIDFQKGLFITEYGENITTYQLDNLPDEKTYLSVTEPEEEDD